VSARDLLTLFFGFGALGAWTFTGLYAWGSRGWWRSGAGRSFMGMMVVLAVLLTLVTVSRWWGPLSLNIWIALIAVLDAVVWWHVIILWRRQHDRR
jgi:hypothetical protein